MTWCPGHNNFVFSHLCRLYFTASHHKLQVQYGAYAGIGGIGNIIKMLFAGMMFLFLVKFSFGRNLLIKVS